MANVTPVIIKRIYKNALPRLSITLLEVIRIKVKKVNNKVILLKRYPFG